MNRKFGFVLAIIALLATVAVRHIKEKAAEPFTEAERAIITQSDSVMNVTTYPKDSIILRAVCQDLSAQELASPLLKTLMDKMLCTVQDPSQDGVGISAPQVGITKRIIWLTRLDLEGEPWRCYLNIHIDSLFGPKIKLPEGCLSLPGLRGTVVRDSSVIVSYIDPSTLQPARDTVHGYTARIFQHECDHLEGRLYTDVADSVYVSNR